MTKAAFGKRRYLALFLPKMAHDAWRDSLILPLWGRGTAAAGGGGGASPSRGNTPPHNEIPLHRSTGGPPPPTEEELTVFTERDGNAVRLTALSPVADRAGLTVGLTLADARARIPELMAIERDHAAEAQRLARIVALCGRYTPMAAAEPPDGAILDITGCTHPFGGEAGLAADLGHRLAAAGVTARLALGDTAAMARARARFGDVGDLGTLPVEALEAAAEVTLALRRAGLKRIGDLASRPRSILAARFGDLPLRLARLMGEEDRPISPDRPLAPIFALRRFAEPIGRVEDALACLGDLLGEAAETLLQRHQGGRRFTARFCRSDGAVPSLTIETGRPTRDAGLVMRLLRERLDALADPIDPGFGFDLIRLDVAATEPLAPAQDGFDRASDQPEALAELVDRLAARLGPARIRRAAPRDTHIPECASAAVAPADLPYWQRATPGEPPLRPLRLFDPPQRIAAVLSEVPDGPPRRFTWARQAHDIVRWEGPERIAAEWWRRRDRGGLTRDYYRVEDAAGHRFWLFRHGLHGAEREAPDWYVHGLFA